jgi:hypothetical protein
MRHFVVEALRDTFLYGSDVAIYTGGGARLGARLG